MAFGHAVDGPGRLLAVLEALANAPEDIASLKSLVANIKMAFEGVQSTTSSISSNRGQFQGSHQSVAASLACVSRLEALVDDSLTKRGRRANERARKVVDSFAWIWRRKEVDAIKQQLQDSVPAVLPEVSSLSFMSQLNLFSAFEDFGTILQGLESRLSPSHQNVNLDNDESVSKRFQVGIRPNINPLNNPIPSYRLLKRPWKERPQINVNR